MIVAAGAPSATRASAAAIETVSETRAVMTTSHVVKTVRRVETGVGTEIKVLMLKQTKEDSKAQADRRAFEGTRAMRHGKAWMSAAGTRWTAETRRTRWAMCSLEESEWRWLSLLMLVLT